MNSTRLLLIFKLLLYSVLGFGICVFALIVGQQFLTNRYIICPVNANMALILAHGKRDGFIPVALSQCNRLDLMYDIIAQRLSYTDTELYEFRSRLNPEMSDIDKLIDFLSGKIDKSDKIIFFGYANLVYEIKNGNPYALKKIYNYFDDNIIVHQPAYSARLALYLFLIMDESYDENTFMRIYQNMMFSKGTFRDYFRKLKSPIND